MLIEGDRATVRFDEKVSAAAPVAVAVGVIGTFTLNDIDSVTEASIRDSPTAAGQQILVRGLVHDA